MSDGEGVLPDVRALLGLSEAGRVSETDAILALGALMAWRHHPSLRESLFAPGGVDAAEAARVLQLAGIIPPWEAE